MSLLEEISLIGSRSPVRRVQACLGLYPANGSAIEGLVALDDLNERFRASTSRKDLIRRSRRTDPTTTIIIGYIAVKWIEGSLPRQRKCEG